jgi:tRNA(fMet)-specific endonuclease VapC
VGDVASRPLIADTDLAIDYLRDRLPGAELVEGWMKAGHLRFAAVTAFELRFGMDFDARQAQIHALLAGRTLALDAEAAVVAGGIAVRLRRAGQDIGVRDVLIAGTCVALGLPLATRNRRHFERIPGLRVIEGVG